MLSAPRQLQSQQELMKTKTWTVSLGRHPLSKLQAQLHQKVLCDQAASQTPVLWRTSLKRRPVQRILQLQSWAEQTAGAQSSAEQRASRRRETRSSCQALPHTVLLSVLRLQLRSWKAFAFQTLTPGSRRVRTWGNPLRTLTLSEAVSKVTLQPAAVPLFALLPRGWAEGNQVTKTSKGLWAKLVSLAKAAVQLVAVSGVWTIQSLLHGQSSEAGVSCRLQRLRSVCLVTHQRTRTVPGAGRAAGCLGWTGWEPRLAWSRAGSADRLRWACTFTALRASCSACWLKITSERTRAPLRMW